MRPISLTLSNFGSFVEEQSFQFPQKPGLYFLWGDNRAEPRLEGNGSGKSTVWKALTWLFYAKTAAGLKAGDVANWSVGKKALVRLRYEMWGVELEVERTWAPNTWTLIASNGHRTDLAKDPTNTCLEELRLEFSAFIQSVVMPQGSDLFLDLKADKQAELFSDVMGLDSWIQRSNRASDRARVEDGECRRLERELAHLDGQIAAARAVNVEDQLRDFEATRRRRLETLAEEHTKYLKLARAKSAGIPVIQASLDNARDRHAQAVTAADKASEKDKCPACGQAVGSKHDHAELRALVRAVDEEESALQTATRDRAQLEKTLDRIEEDAETADGQVNPYTKLRDDTADRVARLHRDAKAVMRAADEAQTRFSAASSWVRWFKEIRLAQIGEALTQLELEVNNQVAALGLLDWELRFDVDRENKGGGIQRGFSVSVLSPHNNKPVPWEAWSGGERQRLIVAAQMGLANLIRARTGTLIDLEVWDEPTVGMSPQGVQDLLEALATRADREKRCIWIVDHRTLGFAGFAGEVGAIKTTKGSHFDFSKLAV